MSFKQNRMDFENALMECEEICNALEVLVKPEILDTFISMITEYRVHYQQNIDEMISEQNHLIEQLDEAEDRICNLLNEIDDKEHEILDYKSDIKQLEREIEKNGI